MAVYGFNERRGRALARIADQPLRRGKAGVRYPEPELNEFQLIPFQNLESGQTLPAYGVAAVTGTATVENQKCLTVIRPDATFRRRYLVNTGAAVAYQGVGLGIWLADAKTVLYESATPALFEEWGPASGSWKLQQHRNGFLIQGANDTTTDPSNLRTIAIQSVVYSVLGKADAEILNAASNTVSVWAGTPGSESDTNQNITGCYNRGPDIASGAWVTVSWLHGKPYVILLNCA